MATTNVWFALLGLPDAQKAEATSAAGVAGRLLVRYLLDSGAKSARVGGLNPSSSSVGSHDLLIHVTLGSLIEGISARLGDETRRGTGSGIPTGATASMGSGGILSEVYWALIHNRGRNDTERGQILASAAFHECVHNKAYAKRYDAESYVHLKGGGGVLQPQPNIGTLMIGPTWHNKSFMREFVNLASGQYTYTLFDDSLGF